MTDNELAACPLHGGRAAYRSTGGGDERTGYNSTLIISVDCCSLTMTGETKQDRNGWNCDAGEGRAALVAAWNQRPKPDSTPDVREALREIELMTTNHSGWADQKDIWPGLNRIHKLARDALTEARSCCEAERETVEALTERLRQAIENEANRQPHSWDWYDLARAAATAIRGADHD